MQKLIIFSAILKLKINSLITSIIIVNRMIWKDYVTFDPKVCHGKACIKGTRVFISIIKHKLRDALGHLVKDLYKIGNRSID